MNTTLLNEQSDYQPVVRLLVAYDGTNFRGLAPNAGVRTVVGDLQLVLGALLGQPVSLVMSGRTDAGVHAWGQVLSFVPPDPDAIDLARMQRTINSRLGPEIVAREVSWAPPGFSARFDATARRYQYQVVNAPHPDPFSARLAWWVPHALDLSVMNRAAMGFVGEHDFSSFCRRPKVEPPLSLVRRVTAARWLVVDEPHPFSSGSPDRQLMRFEIEGSAFCHQMVRSIVGFCVAVGRGKRQPHEVGEVLAARDRGAAEQPAPPHGLTLWSVSYTGERVDTRDRSID